MNSDFFFELCVCAAMLPVMAFFAAIILVLVGLGFHTEDSDDITAIFWGALFFGFLLVIASVVFAVHAMDAVKILVVGV